LAGRPKGKDVHQEYMPISMHIMESMVSTKFLDVLEDFMIVSEPKLTQLSQEFGEAKTQYRVGSLNTHCPEVELEVI